MSLTTWSLLGAVVPALLLIAMTLAKTGGVWEYALDDAYIHLAMSEQLWRGGYGVNPGEYASASSSILYSYLLAPFTPFAFQVYWPLVLGLVALVASAVLWARVLQTAAEGAPQVTIWALTALAVLGPMFLGWHNVALIGMEHMLHVMVTLMAVLGLVQFARDGRIGWLLILGIVLNPVLRFEGMAIAVVGSAVLFFGGRKLAGVGLLAVALMPLVAHFALMSQLGLEMLPNSVNAKAAILGGGERLEDVSGWTKVQHALWITQESPSGRMLLATLVIGIFALLISRRVVPKVYQLLAIALIVAVAGHVFVGQSIWYYRYEVYVWTFAVGIGAVFFTQITFSSLQKRTVVWGGFVLAVLFGGAHYPVVAFNYVPSGGAAVYAQQRQTAAFVKEYWREPVAVNDIGHVAYRNPNYVLDLWGLASAEALHARLRGTDELWADKLATQNGVRAALIYKRWLGKHIPPHWIEVAQFRLNIPLATLGNNIVSVYAIRSDAVAPLKTALMAFEPTLPETTSLTYLENSK